jgi:hypothetical protein
MTDLPAIANSRPRSVWDIFMSGGFEAVTRAVMNGSPIRDVDDLAAFERRCNAFSRALRARLAAQGMQDELMEEDDGISG